jgi:hypothetical protein
MARSRTADPAAGTLDARAPVADLPVLRQKLQRALIDGGNTAGIRAQIAEAEAQERGQAALLVDVQEAAAWRLEACAAASAAGRVASFHAELSALLGKLKPPPSPLFS